MFVLIGILFINFPAKLILCEAKLYKPNLAKHPASTFLSAGGDSNLMLASFCFCLLDVPCKQKGGRTELLLFFKSVRGLKSQKGGRR